MASLEEIVNLIKKKKAEGKTIFIAGNGGSAANAEHFTNDLFSRGIKAICLNSNVSIMTMIANDYGYEYVFKKQLEVLAGPQDLLIVISCSGTSPNIIRALEVNMEACTVFGGQGTYEDMETVHLDLFHETVKLLGEKSL